MRVLGIETSEYVSSLALWVDGALVAEQTFESRMNLCETLTPRLAELLGVTHAAAAELDGLAVSLGPGSFTGLRVGLATAKALAHACGWKLVGICTQEAIAAAADEPPETVVGVVQTARQGHVYAGRWQMTGGAPEALSTIEVVALADLGAFLGSDCAAIIGPAAGLVLEAEPGLAEKRRLRTVLPTAAAVAALGAARLDQADPEAAYTLQPMYLLVSQAERAKQLVVAAGTAGPGAEAPRCLVLRRGALDDLAAVVRIENASFSAPWPEQSLRDEITRSRGSLFLVAELDGEVVGYAGAWLYAGEVHICNVAVAPELRRSGLAEILVLNVLDHALALQSDLAILEYRVSNEPAAGLYAKLGFQPIGRRKGYYQDTGEDAIVASIADLATAERQAALAACRLRWEQRYRYDLHVTF